MDQVNTAIFIGKVTLYIEDMANRKGLTDAELSDILKRINHCATKISLKKGKGKNAQIRSKKVHH